MLLAIDIGNTNIVFAVYDGEDKKADWRVETQTDRPKEEYATLFIQFFAEEGLLAEQISAAIASSVVPAMNDRLQEFVQQQFGCNCFFVSANDIDLPIQLDSPDEIGSDRLVNAVAVVGYYKKAAIVIDFGTATTFDIIDGQGAYCGGVIAPGPHLSMEALYQAAAKLPRVEIKQPPNVIGKNTVHAMQSGLFWGYVSMIEGLLDRLISEMNWETDEEVNEDPYIIATGGLATLFSSAIPAIETVDNDLTLRGLSYIHYHSRN